MVGTTSKSYEYLDFQTLSHIITDYKLQEELEVGGKLHLTLNKPFTVYLRAIKGVNKDISKFTLLKQYIYILMYMFVYRSSLHTSH